MAHLAPQKKNRGGLRRRRRRRRESGGIAAPQAPQKKNKGGWRRRRRRGRKNARFRRKCGAAGAAAQKNTYLFLFVYFKGILRGFYFLDFFRFTVRETARRLDFLFEPPLLNGFLWSASLGSPTFKPRTERALFLIPLRFFCKGFE